MKCCCWKCSENDRRFSTTTDNEGNVVVKVCRHVDIEKRIAFNNSLIYQIKKLRARENQCSEPNLTFSFYLSQIAEFIWNALAIKRNGLIAIPNNQFLMTIHKGGKNPESRGEFIGCMSFTDNIVRRNKKHMARDALFYWTHQGRYISTPSRLAWNNRTVTLDEETESTLNVCRELFMPMLLGKGDFDSDRIGIHFGKKKRRDPYSVVIVFDQGDIENI